MLFRSYMTKRRRHFPRLRLFDFQFPDSLSALSSSFVLTQQELPQGALLQPAAGPGLLPPEPLPDPGRLLPAAL